MISRIAITAISAILMFSLISFIASLLARANIAIISPRGLCAKGRKPYANVKVGNPKAYLRRFIFSNVSSSSTLMAIKKASFSSLVTS